MFEPEGNACSLTDSTAEEHVLALVEHAADEARDRISRVLPGGKVALPEGRLWHPAGQLHSVRAELSAVGASPSLRCRPGGVPCHLQGPDQLLLLAGSASGVGVRGALGADARIGPS